MRDDVAGARGDGKSEPSVDDLMKHVMLADLRAGERGWLFTATTQQADDDNSRTAIWYCNRLGTVRPMVWSGGAPVWSSDGEDFAFTRQIDGRLEAFVLPMAGGEARQVTHGLDRLQAIEDFDGRGSRLLILRACEDSPPDAPVVAEHLPYKLDGVGTAAAQRVELGLLDADSGEYCCLVAREGQIKEARWDSRFKRIAFVQTRPGRERHWTDLFVREADGEARRLTDTLPSVGGIRWSPDGSRIALAASPREGEAIVQLYVVDVESAECLCLDIELDAPDAIEWQEDGLGLRVVQASRGSSRVVTVDLSGRITVVWEHPTRQVLGMAACGGALGLLLAGPDAVPELWIVGAEGGNARRVSDFNAWRGERPPLDARKRKFRVPDGFGGIEEIEGWLVLPEGEGPHPLLLDMHGGPQSHVRFEFERLVHWPVLVEHGWAVLALDAVGSASYGLEFARRLCGHWGELDWPQWEAAVAHLRNEGVCDSCVAVFGHSYGGFLAAWALTRAPELCCGIASGPIANIESHTGTSDTGYYVGPYAMDIKEDYRLRERSRALSPATHAHAIRSPLLLLQGADDQRCPRGQSEELLTAVSRSGATPVRLTLFPGAGHHVSTTGRPNHRRAYYRELVDWLERWRNNRSRPVSNLPTCPPAERPANEARIPEVRSAPQ